MYLETFGEEICYEPHKQHMVHHGHEHLAYYCTCTFGTRHHTRTLCSHQPHPCRSPILDLWVNRGDLQLLQYDHTTIHQQILKCKKPVT